MKRIVFTPASARQWVKLAADVRRRIDRRLTEFAINGTGDVKRLKGRAGSRLRIGDWRVIFYEESGAMVVVAVGHRREVYD
jgi:mRNA interferase RelE/StbE